MLQHGKFTILSAWPLAGKRDHSPWLARAYGGGWVGIQPHKLCAVAPAGLPNQRVLLQMAGGQEGLDWNPCRQQRLCSQGDFNLLSFYKYMLVLICPLSSTGALEMQSKGQVSKKLGRIVGQRWYVPYFAGVLLVCRRRAEAEHDAAMEHRFCEMHDVPRAGRC